MLWITTCNVPDYLNIQMRKLQSRSRNSSTSYDNLLDVKCKLELDSDSFWALFSHNALQESKLIFGFDLVFSNGSIGFDSAKGQLKGAKVNKNKKWKAEYRTLFGRLQA